MLAASHDVELNEIGKLLLGGQQFFLMQRVYTRTDIYPAVIKAITGIAEQVTRFKFRYVHNMGYGVGAVLVHASDKSHSCQ